MSCLNYLLCDDDAQEVRVPPAPTVRFAKLSGTSKVPQQMRAGDAGYDLAADHDFVVRDGEVTSVCTNIAVEIPPGHVGFICPRSGLSARFGITVVNAPGVIDSNYRGELIVLLTRLTPGVTGFKAGDRVAQLVITPICALPSTEVDAGDLSLTNRGELGFGSSGV
jgi:dUTP pyrophosphatase